MVEKEIKRLSRDYELAAEKEGSLWYFFKGKGKNKILKSDRAGLTTTEVEGWFKVWAKKKHIIDTDIWFKFKLDSSKKVDKVFSVRYLCPATNKYRDCRIGKRSQDISLPKCRTLRAGLIAGKRKHPADMRRAKEEAKKVESKTQLTTIFNIWAEPRKNTASFFAPEGWHRNHLTPFFGAEKDLTILVEADVEGFRDELVGKGLSPQSIKHILKFAKTLLRLAGNNIKVELPTVKNHTREDLSDSELSELEKVLTTYPHPVIVDALKFVMATGVRLGEISRLQIKHVDFKRKKIHLEDRKSTTGSNTDCDIPLSSEAEEIVKRRRKENLKVKGSNQYIFPSADGGMLRNMDTKHSRKIMDMAGIKKSFRPFHGMRHFYANECVDAGVQVHVLSRLLGHQDITVTQRYYEAREKSLVEASEIIAQRRKDKRMVG